MAEPARPLLSRQQTLGALAVAWVAYGVVVVVGHTVVGSIVGAVAILPAMATGYVLGRRAGVAAALLAVVGTRLILTWLGAPLVSDLPRAAVGYLVVVVAGWAAGWLGTSFKEVRDQRNDLAREVALRTAAEADRDRTRQNWETLLVNAPDYILVIDADERVAFVNRTPPGLDPAAVQGKPITNFVPDPAQQEQLRQTIQRAFRERRSSLLEINGPGPDGTAATYRCRIFPTTDSHGAPAALMINVDITKSLAAERALEQRNAELARAQEVLQLAGRATNDVIWDLDLGSGRLMWGDAFEKVFGHPMGALEPGIGSWLARIHPDDLPRIDASFAAALAGPAVQWHDSYRFRRADGRYADVLDRAIIVRDPRGRARRAVGAMTDVSQLKQAEADLRAALAATEAAVEALRSSEARWRSLAENAPAYIITCDAEGRITFVNRYPAGMTPEEVLGRPVWEFAPPGTDQQAVRERILATVRTKTPQLLETQGPGPNGQVRWYSMHWSPVLGAGGQVDSVIAMAFDVTEQREMARLGEEARRRAEEHRTEAQRLKDMADFKTQFLNNAAHELATPLTPLKLQLATMRPLLASRDPAGFDLLERNVNRLGALVDDLLDAARLQSGHLRLVVTRVPLDDLLARIALSFRAQAQEAGVTLGVHPSGERLRVPCDEMRVEQVLFNLVHNAIKFTPRGGQVWLRAERDGQHVAVQVQDTGAGLSPEQMGRLFQPFTQVHDPRHARAGGTGLGLYIARGIAHQHGGSLEAQSPGPGAGCTFTIRLPAAGPPGVEIRESLEATPRRGAGPGRAAPPPSARREAP